MDRKDAEGIFYIHREIQRLEYRLRELRFKASGKGVAFGGVPGARRKTDFVGDLAAETADYEAEIAELKLKGIIKASEIADFISSIDDSLLRLIIFLRCIKLHNWQQMAFEIGGNTTEHSVKKQYYRFFE